MKLSNLFTIIGYAGTAVVTAVPTLGLSLPAWAIAAITGVSVFSAKMAASHSDTINAQATAQAAGEAAQAASNALSGGTK